MPSKGQLKGEYVNCEWCGKLVYKTPSQLAKHEHHLLFIHIKIWTAIKLKNV